ncbi:hypothetical protein GCM10010104_49030 [Streptomyces indiaensis]|uniref:Uncharacterized protein n=1 Tax=Streptomyces indiaensis TaxID=284033 RepID=A0ABP5QXJ5_9ACTN
MVGPALPGDTQHAPIGDALLSNKRLRAILTACRHPCSARRDARHQMFWNAFGSWDMTSWNSLPGTASPRVMKTAATLLRATVSSTPARSLTRRTNSATPIFGATSSGGTRGGAISAGRTPAKSLASPPVIRSAGGSIVVRVSSPPARPGPPAQTGKPRENRR